MNSVASVILLLSPDQSKEYSKPSCGRSGMLTTFCWYLPAALPYLRPPYNQRLDGIFMQSEAHGLNSAFSCQAAVAAASSKMQESADFSFSCAASFCKQVSRQGRPVANSSMMCKGHVALICHVLHPHIKRPRQIPHIVTVCTHQLSCMRMLRLSSCISHMIWHAACHEDNQVRSRSPFAQVQHILLITSLCCKAWECHACLRTALQGSVQPAQQWFHSVLLTFRRKVVHCAHRTGPRLAFEHGHSTSLPPHKQQPMTHLHAQIEWGTSCTASASCPCAATAAAACVVSVVSRVF